MKLRRREIVTRKRINIMNVLSFFFFSVRLKITKTAKISVLCAIRISNAEVQLKISFWGKVELKGVMIRLQVRCNRRNNLKNTLVSF